MSKPQFTGSLKKMQSANGVEYYKGKVCNVPMVGFMKHDKEGDKLILQIDVGLVQWISEQEGEPNGNSKNNPETPF